MSYLFSTSVGRSLEPVTALVADREGFHYAMVVNPEKATFIPLIIRSFISISIKKLMKLTVVGTVWF